MARRKKVMNGRLQKRADTLRLVWLEVFALVAMSNSQSKAAEVLGLTPGQVSRYMFDLQRWLRKSLFETNFPPTLNAEGEAFLAVAGQVIELLRGSQAKIPPKVDPRDIVIS